MTSTSAASERDGQHASLRLYENLRQRLAGTPWQALSLLGAQASGTGPDDAAAAGGTAVDCAYVSGRRNPVQELRELAFELIGAGFAVHAAQRCLTVRDLDPMSAHVRIFHETGVAGASDVRVLDEATIEEIYWADFYARTSYDSGSSFCDLVCSREGMPTTVLDIGCGDGRDSFALARAGFVRVRGIDRSHIGLEHAQRKARQLGLHDQVGFDVCDVSDVGALRRMLGSVRTPGEPLLFYARFFLHSINADLQHTLLHEIDVAALPGDFFAAEFRTDRDRGEGKAHGAHYRRFQNGPAFGRELAQRYHFAPFVEQEGNGFSPYRGEDPYLYRVLAKRV